MKKRRQAPAPQVEARRARVAKYLAHGACRQEIRVLLGMSDTPANWKVLDRDMAAVRAKNREAIEQSRDLDLAVVAETMNRLEVDLEQARKIRDSLEPGTPEWSDAEKRALERESVLLKARLDLGLVLKAPQRIVVMAGDDLAALDGDALQERLGVVSERAALVRRLLGTDGKAKP